MLILISLILISIVIIQLVILNLNNNSSLGREVGTSIVPALYIFGDSLFDNGNNNWLPTFAKANYLPYGQNFSNGPTGRFTNGKTVADFIADYVGLPYPPPYVSPFKSTMFTGYNYASGSCGILPQTSTQIGLCMSLGEQIRMFEKTVKRELKVSEKLSKSILLFSVGNNDFLCSYFGFFSVITTRLYTPLQFVRLFIGKLSLHLQKVYKLGARKIVVFEVGPIGCIPSSVMKNHHDDHEGEFCDEKKNEIVLMYNKYLALMLNNLTSTLKGSHFILGHVYSLSYHAILNPSNYGLTDSRNPCCRTWKNGTVMACIPEVNACSNPDKHYFWDGYHPTQTPNSLLATKCFNGSGVCLPINIHQLVHL